MVVADDDEDGVRFIGTVVVADEDEDGVRFIGTVVVADDDDDEGCLIGDGIGTGTVLTFGIQSPILFRLYPF